MHFFERSCKTPSQGFAPRTSVDIRNEIPRRTRALVCYADRTNLISPVPRAYWREILPVCRRDGRPVGLGMGAALSRDGKLAPAGAAEGPLSDRVRSVQGCRLAR